MRQPYFTEATLRPVTDELYEQHVNKHHTVDDFRPEHSALLVLDCQQYFFHPDSHAFAPSAPPILGGILDMIDEFQQRERPVILTRHENTLENAGRMASWWRDLLTADHPFAALLPELEERHLDTIRKTQYDAFLNSDLDARLRSAGVQQVVVTGVLTHLCCETTARSAFMHGYDVFFPVDGTATYSIDYHRGSLKNLAHACASLTRMSDLLHRMEKI
ncbi:cysteine hydrolase [bacterium]|nr:cysteine hydrolase [bacterium]